MDPQHITYHHGHGQLAEMPRHPPHHHPGMPPGAVPVVMNQLPAGFMPYGPHPPRYNRPMYMPMQSPHAPRQPSVVLPPPTTVYHMSSPRHGGDSSMRMRYLMPSLVGLPPQNVKTLERPLPPLLRPPISAVREEAPLDLSSKPKSIKSGHSVVMKPVAHAAIVVMSDQPLDLSKPSKVKDLSTLKHSPIGSGSMVGANQHKVPLKASPGHGSEHSSRTVGNDTELELSNVPNSHTSNSSLLGDHPIDDILYLHCARCPSSYGSVHAFRKHFRNSHGDLPARRDVMIQSIKATKEYVMNSSELRTPTAAAPHLPRRHCNYCGWQCEQTDATKFSGHMREHYEVRGCFYRCVYCQEEFSEPNALRQHVVQHSVYHHICPYCCIAFPMDEQLASHMFTQHGMGYSNRKVNLPVSVVLPSQSSIPPVGQPGLSPKHVSQSLARIKPSHSQTYADHVHLSKMSQEKCIDSPRSSSMSTHGPIYPYHSAQLAKSGMMLSPRYVEASKAPTSVPSAPTPAVGDVNKQGTSPSSSQHQIMLMSLFDRVVENGLKTTESRYSQSGSANPSAHNQRSTQLSTVSSNENGAAIRLSAYNNPPFPGPARPPGSHPGLIDLSHKPPYCIYSQHAAVTPSYTVASKMRPTMPPSNAVETVDLTKHRTVSSVPLSTVVTPVRMDLLQNRMPIPPRSSAFSSPDHPWQRFPPPLLNSRPLIPLTTQTRLPLGGGYPNISCPNLKASGRTNYGSMNTTTTFTPVKMEKNNLGNSSHSQPPAKRKEVVESKADKVIDINGAVDFRLHKNVGNLNTISGNDYSMSNGAVIKSLATTHNKVQESKLASAVTASESTVLDIERSAQTDVGKVDSDSKYEQSENRALVLSAPNPTFAFDPETNPDRSASSGPREIIRTCGPSEDSIVTSCSSSTSSGQNSSLKFQVNTSAVAVDGDNVISSIIEKAVKSALVSPVQDNLAAENVQNCCNTLKPDGQDISSNTRTGSSSSSNASSQDAIPVSWGQKTKSELGVDVNTMQAMSACRVLLSPHNMPTNGSQRIKLESTVVPPSVQKYTSDEGKNGGMILTRSKRVAETNYVEVDDGVLDMSNKSMSAPTAMSNYSDSSACSSPKRLRIVETD